MNKHRPHVYVLPEDDADRQIAVGFASHLTLDTRRMQVMPVLGGWGHVLEEFKAVYVQHLRNFPLGHVVMVIDFDGHHATRRAEFHDAVPTDVRDRVFVVGAAGEPQDLKRELHQTFEQIGRSLADDCANGTTDRWDHDLLKHNDADRRRLAATVRSVLFPGQPA